MSPPTPPDRAALSRDLAAFLIELSIALHKHAMYPADHPALRPAAATVAQRAEVLLLDRTSLSLGVARHQLVIEGVATDAKHPVLRELADRLHRHHLGAVTVTQGVEVEELRDVLRTLAVEAERTGAPLGLGPPDALRRWPHVRLHPLTYERLELVDEGDAPPPDAELRNARTRGAQLWVGLARAALASEGSDAPPPSTEPAVIAKAIDDRSPQVAAAYDQAIVGYLLQIAEELKSAGSADAVALRRRTARLIRSLKPSTLRHLLEMGGDLAQRRKFVADATDGMALEAVLDIVRAAADTSHQTVSHALVRMLSKFAAHAEAGTAEARPQADAALRQQVRSLLQGWNLADPTPAAYGAALQRMARAAPVFDVAPDRVYPTEPDRLAAMGLELDVTSPIVCDAVDRMVADGRLPQLMDALDEVAPPTAAATALWARIATVDVVRQLGLRDPPDFAALDRLTPRVGPPAADPLLDGLAAAESRGTRRGFLSVLVRLGPGVGPFVARRLSVGAPWYVTRNLLTLLDEIGTVPAGFSLVPYAAHADARVRWQALKLQLKAPAERDRALAQALGDRDDRVVRLALTAVQRDCPERVVPLVVRHAVDRARGADVRTAAIRVLGSVRGVAARDALLRITSGGRTLFGRERLAPTSPELIAALTALAAGWAEDRAARRVLAQAAASPDAAVRGAAGAEPHAR